MRRVIAAFMTLAIGFAATGIASTSASAAQPNAPAVKALIDKLAPAKPAAYSRRCARTYRYCRNKYGGAYLFRNCMRFRGCWDYWNYFDRGDRRSHRRHYDRRDRTEYSCSYYRDACAQNWGYGNNDYYGCLRYHRCD